MKKKAFLFILFFLLSFALFANSYTGSSDNDAFILRAPIWVFLEPEPGYFTEEKRAEFLPPKKAVLEFSRYVLAGMAYGWKFSYTPYDKKRGVKEVFELVPIKSIGMRDKSVKVTDVDVKYPYCYCWVEYRLPEAYRLRHDFWKSGSYKVIKSRGKGDRSDELQGVYDAYRDAAKNAIRAYGRKILKNKPKEINGEILIKDSPRLFVASGYFQVDLELYLNLLEVIPYKIY